MKKEFLTLVQFVFITGLVAVCLNLYLPLQYPGINAEAVEGMTSDLRYWIYSFVGLGAIRLGIYYVRSRQAAADADQSAVKIFLSELSNSFQYFIIAVFAIFGAFWLVLFNLENNGFSIDLLSVWFGIHYQSLTWLAAFSILSLLRLKTILIWSIVFHNRHSAKL